MSGRRKKWGESTSIISTRLPKSIKNMFEEKVPESDRSEWVALAIMEKLSKEETE